MHHDKIHHCSVIRLDFIQHNVIQYNTMRKNMILCSMEQIVEFDFFGSSLADSKS